MSSLSSPTSTFTAFKQYEPNEPAAIVFTVVFALLLFAHVWQSVRAKVWYMWPLILATAVEVVGYVLRELAAVSNTFILVFIIIAPACLAANLYMLVGRAILFVGPGYAIMRPAWITPVFVGFDVLAIATQGVGSAIIFGTDNDIDKMRTGRTVLILGLFIQLVAFFAFLLLAMYFDRKTTVALRQRVAFLRPLMNAFYITGAFILLRSIYRAVEFISLDFNQRPPNGYLYVTEWPYFVLDAVPIAAATFVYNVLFPSRYLPRTKKERLGKDDQMPMAAYSHA
ncbi:hypothetical protein M408DRAFT_82469 [Serendipita vermifera MAFF 305830]|uniref:RTA1 like protein n=1 Tax=Serendipita vermifera MAFF 305830 TaxID=933852 RepID=A0A0C2WRE3_SERVB|nr:hypothetical protein M408DRAFT_82469 [Serendipita vermifera MAFF 305830]